MGIRNAFPWSAKQNERISTAAVAPDVNMICEGSNDTPRPKTLDMKFAIACKVQKI